MKNLGAKYICLQSALKCIYLKNKINWWMDMWLLNIIIVDQIISNPVEFSKVM